MTTFKKYDGRCIYLNRVKNKDKYFYRIQIGNYFPRIKYCRTRKGAISFIRKLLIEDIKYLTNNLNKTKNLFNKFAFEVIKNKNPRYYKEEITY